MGAKLFSRQKKSVCRWVRRLVSLSRRPIPARLWHEVDRYGFHMEAMVCAEIARLCHSLREEHSSLPRAATGPSFPGCRDISIGQGFRKPWSSDRSDPGAEPLMENLADSGNSGNAAFPTQDHRSGGIGDRLSHRGVHSASFRSRTGPLAGPSIPPDDGPKSDRECLPQPACLTPALFPLL